MEQEQEVVAKQAWKALQQALPQPLMREEALLSDTKVEPWEWLSLWAWPSDVQPPLASGQQLLAVPVLAHPEVSAGRGGQSL